MTTGEFILYQNQEGTIKIDVHPENETVWLTQAQMAELFSKGRTTVTEHIQNVFAEGELDAKWLVGISDIPLNTVQRKALCAAILMNSLQIPYICICQ